MKKASSVRILVYSLSFLATVSFAITAQAADAPASPEPAAKSAADYAGKPYTGTPQVIPGIIQAEAYDIGPDTFSYHGEAKKTDCRTSPDSIGLAKFGKGHVTTTGQPEAPDQVYVGWTQTGEWLKYTVQVKEAGTYVFGGKFSAGAKGAKISVTFTPQITTGPIEIPTTAGFQPSVEVYHVWETLNNLATLNLPAGTYVMTVKIEAVAGMNLDYFTFTKKP